MYIRAIQPQLASKSWQRSPALWSRRAEIVHIPLTVAIIATFRVMQIHITVYRKYSSGQSQYDSNGTHVVYLTRCRPSYQGCDTSTSSGISQ